MLLEQYFYKFYSNQLLNIIPGTEYVGCLHSICIYYIVISMI